MEVFFYAGFYCTTLISPDRITASFSVGYCALYMPIAMPSWFNLPHYHSSRALQHQKEISAIRNKLKQYQRRLKVLNNALIALSKRIYNMKVVFYKNSKALFFSSNLDAFSRCFSSEGLRKWWIETAKSLRWIWTREGLDAEQYVEFTTTGSLIYRKIALPYSPLFL